MKRIAGLFTTLLLLMTLASCDSRKTAGENPFFTEWDTPHGVPPFDKILPEHFMPAFERGMSLHEAEIDAITSNKDEATFENTILAYDQRPHAGPARAGHAPAGRAQGQDPPRRQALRPCEGGLRQACGAGARRRADAPVAENLRLLRACRGVARRRAEGPPERDQRAVVAHGREIRE